MAGEYEKAITIEKAIHQMRKLFENISRKKTPDPNAVDKHWRAALEMEKKIYKANQPKMLRIEIRKN